TRLAPDEDADAEPVDRRQGPVQPLEQPPGVARFRRPRTELRRRGLQRRSRRPVPLQESPQPEIADAWQQAQVEERPQFLIHRIHGAAVPSLDLALRTDVLTPRR